MRPRRRAERAKGSPAPLPALGLVAFLACHGLAPVVAAEEGWTPTVATVPGGSFAAPTSGYGNRTPPAIDPRFFPSQRVPVAPARSPVPRGAWSPIVTGAVPPAPDTAREPPTAPAGDGPAMVPPVDPLSPVRPTGRPAIAAAEAKAPEKPAADPAGGAGQGAAPEAAADSIFRKPDPLAALPPDATAAEQYCFNTSETAADARFAWQARKIQEMEAELEKRAAQLQAKTDEFKTWLARRDEFSRKAHEKLVGFYSRMRPDAAALQLAELDEEMAAAVVMKLETKAASQILGEMEPERAAKIAAIISGAGKIPANRKPPPAAAAEAKPAEAPAAAPQGAASPEGPRS